MPAHLGSYRTWAEQIGVPFAATLDRARANLASAVSQDGASRISCQAGLLRDRES